ncbi:MAG: M56 family metallopeptidase, partial [Acidobacteria bacterium]|nr:M56 family metallopeptidase [Acidobacteriota bacterium]
TGAHDGLDWIAAHELAHLRRWDDWTQLGQRILLCLAFFHPLALWISRRLDLERELACDQMASASVGLSAGAYASGLVRFSRSLVMARHWAALSMASRLAERVEALSVRPQISRPRVSLRAPIFVLLLCTAAAIAASRPLLAVSVRSAGDAGRGQAITEVEELVQRLRSRDPRTRAIAAYRLGQLRAEPAIPALLPLVADPTELPREPGSMSQPWGRPEERAEGTSVGEEAVKALLFIGQAALRPLEDELSRSAETPNPFARWAVDLLADFD